MGKYDEYSEKIRGLLNGKVTISKLESFISSNSSLPGPRANLELASAFADYFDQDNISDEVWDMLQKWMDMGSDKAPTNDPREFIPFCEVQALGSLYFHVDEDKQHQIISRLKAAMNDERWRMREAVAMGFQRIAEKDFDVVKKLFQSMVEGSNFLEKRTFVAALAHPPILKEKSHAQFCLEISDDIMDEIVSASENSLNTEDFRVLSKGLEYAISVFVENLPDEGFEMMKKFARVNQKDIRRIIKSNLGKTRLTKKYGKQVEEVLSLLGK